MKTHIITILCCLCYWLGISQSITGIEYFYNTDPGFGNATPLTPNANAGSLTQSFNISVPTDAEGFNVLYFRTKDENNIWSLYANVIFYITYISSELNSTNIISAEYFIDTDPGFGNANPIAIEANLGNITQQVSIPLGTLEDGFHNLYIRTQDDLGVWSLYDNRLFYVRPEQVAPPIVAAEFFYDSDPGFGNGTPLTITSLENRNEFNLSLDEEFAVDLTTTDVSCGFHDFYIRLMNEDGTWSFYDYGLQIEVLDNADPTIVVFEDITVELDANGQGSLTIMDVDNGSFDDCELIAVELDQPQYEYTCANLGANAVTITATDAESKVSSQEVTITVVDNTNPLALGQDITVDLAGNPSVTITAEDVNNGSSDNCGSVTLSIDVDTFTLPGDYLVLLSVEDASGNISSETVTVTVMDSALSVADFNNLNTSIKIHPNPAKRNLQFETSSSITSLSIIDITGKTIIKQQNPKNQIEIDQLSYGLYFISFTTDGGQSIIKRFIKE